ncbi:MAG: molybdenum cofactor guanylyltransferase [Phycisphaerales bacterium]|nr:MAG: molybdenum cofactor guanylyltransferase [Phycisphaerales bacterium]
MTDGSREVAVCVAGVLAGGRSRRMGRPKALLTLPDGRTLVEHVVGVASAVAHDVVILGTPALLPPPLARLPVLVDAKQDGGPLAGLCSLLQYAQNRWALLLACDMPHLAPGVLHRILARAGEDVDAVAFRQDDVRKACHACCALYHPRILPRALDELARGQASLQNLLARVRLEAVQPDPRDVHLLTNLNTPEDHARALRDLQDGAIARHHE